MRSPQPNWLSGKTMSNHESFIAESKLNILMNQVLPTEGKPHFQKMKTSEQILAIRAVTNHLTWCLTCSVRHSLEVQLMSEIYFTL